MFMKVTEINVVIITIKHLWHKLTSGLCIWLGNGPVCIKQG